MEKPFEPRQETVAAVRDFESKFPWLVLLSPTNKAEQKKLFLAEETEEPRFTYQHIDLPALPELPDVDPPLGALYRERIQFCRDMMALLQNRGNDDVFPGISQSLFPLQEIDASRRDYPSEAYEGAPVYANQVAQHLRTALQECKLPDWDVAIVSNISSGVLVTYRHIMVSEDCAFPEEEMLPTIRHEMTHVFRLEYGARQHEPLLHIGTARGRRIEEGVSVFFERPKNLTYMFDIYEAVTLARNHTFRETWKLLRGKGHDPSAAWDFTLRAKRGLGNGASKGAFTKDAGYLTGYLDVMRYAERGGDVRPLLAGRIHMDDIEMLKAEADLVIPEIPRILKD